MAEISSILDELARCLSAHNKGTCSTAERKRIMEEIITRSGRTRQELIEAWEQKDEVHQQHEEDKPQA